MMLSSYSDVFSISHERDYEEEIHAGDLVRTGPNLYPHFEVVAVHGDKAWVRNVQNGADHLALISRCRKINGQPAVAA
jgi:ABC-type tungstate transport system permease subunit